MTWHTTTRIAEHIYLISEPFGAIEPRVGVETANMYLVIGQESAALIDSGLGIGDMVVGAITLAEHIHRMAEKYDVLIALHTEATFVQRLQWVIDTDRFVLWNEPDIAYPYLFNHVAGEAHRTQTTVRAAMERFFSDQPDGLPGNDDTGTLSAWFVFSAMGFYPDAPGIPRFQQASPYETVSHRAPAVPQPNELRVDHRQRQGGAPSV